MSLLEVTDLALTINSQHIFGPLSFKLNKGHKLGIMGPNGGGKSSLAKCLAKILPASSGIINWNSGPHKISYVPQINTVNSVLPLTLREYLLLAAQNSQEELKVDEYIKLSGLQDKTNKSFAKMSGGEKQRCLLIKALIKRPDALILDEPFTGLDSEGTDFFLNILKSDYHKDLALIIIDHNINYLLDNCDHILCLNKKSHWHHPHGHVSQDLINDIYHCEFEHQLIHKKMGPEADHHHCHTHGDAGPTKNENEEC